MNLSVLAVEDNLINQKLIEVQLTRIGCQFEMVEDGRKALSFAESKHFDLIILDLHMPYVSGFDVAKTIRDSDFPCKKAFIVALTANINEEDESHSKEAGMNLFIEKPLSKARMEQILQSYESYKSQ